MLERFTNKYLISFDHYHYKAFYVFASSYNIIRQAHATPIRGAEKDLSSKQFWKFVYINMGAGH